MWLRPIRGAEPRVQWEQPGWPDAAVRDPTGTVRDRLYFTGRRRQPQRQEEKEEEELRATGTTQTGAAVAAVAVAVAAAAPTMTSAFACPTCGVRRCTYVQLQTRSADEAMTVFCRCTACGTRWSDAG